MYHNNFQNDSESCLKINFSYVTPRLKEKRCPSLLASKPKNIRNTFINIK